MNQSPDGNSFTVGVQKAKTNCDSEGSHDVLTIKSVTVKRVIEHLRLRGGALCFSSH